METEYVEEDMNKTLGGERVHFQDPRPQSFTYNVWLKDYTRV